MIQDFLFNKKAQFFIASAVIIIFVITAVFFLVSKVEPTSTPVLLQKDLSFFVTNVKEEFGKVVEIALSDVSRDSSLSPSDYLDSNLSQFSRYVQIQGIQRGILINVTAGRLSASNSSMNASVNLSFLSQGSVVNVNFYALRQIALNTLNGSLVTTPTCTLNTTVKKEFGEPITGLNSSNFALRINGTSCSSPTYTERVVGKYNVTCSTSCVSSVVVVDVTEHRNIFVTNQIPNTGRGNGCAGTCGQPLD